MRSGPPPTTAPRSRPLWSRHRLAVAAGAVGAALFAGAIALGAAAGGDIEAAALTGLLGVVLAAVTLLAVVDPRAIVAVPVASLLVVWTVVARSDDPGWSVVLILSLAVAAAELAGLAGRLGVVVPRHVGDGGLQAAAPRRAGRRCHCHRLARGPARRDRAGWWQR